MAGHGSQRVADGLGRGPAAVDDRLGHRLAQPDGLGRLTRHGRPIDGERVGGHGRQVRDDAGPHGIQYGSGGDEHVSETGESVQVEELPADEFVLLQVCQGARPRGDADDGGEPRDAVAVVDQHRHHVRIARFGDQARLLGEFADRRSGEAFRAAGLAAGQLEHAAAGAAEQNPAGVIGDDSEGAGQGMGSGRPLLDGPGAGMAGAAQNQESQTVRVQPLHRIPPGGEHHDLVLVQSDPTPLRRCVRRHRSDDDESAALPQPRAQPVKNATTILHERVHQPHDDQVVTLFVQRGRVVALDVQMQPAHALNVGVLLAGPGERTVREIDGVHGIAEGGEVSGQLAGAASHVECPAAAFRGRDVLGEELPLVLTDLPEPLDVAEVLLPLVAGDVRQRAAPRVTVRWSGCAARSRARVWWPRSTSSGSPCAAPYEMPETASRTDRTASWAALW